MNTEDFAGRECSSLGEEDLTLIDYPNRETSLGALNISRALPIRDRRMVGAWCFLDRFGPLTFSGEKPMNVLPHPHIGLQTITWLLDGEVLHTDSLGSEAILHPGGVNVMTAGKGIAHAEETPNDNRGALDGIQLWTALLDEHRHIPPSFTKLEEVPVVELSGGIVRLFAGEMDDLTSPAPHFSEILGADVQIHSHEICTIPLKPEFEHAILLLHGDCSLEGEALGKKSLYYLGKRRDCLSLNSKNGCRLLLIGGLPFPERILMWWNFVARTPEEIAQARSDWEAERRFGKVPLENRQRLSAPSLARFAQPNPMS